MMFIVFLTAERIGHIFHDIAHVKEFYAANHKHHRVEVWHKNKLSSIIFG